MEKGLKPMVPNIPWQLKQDRFRFYKVIANDKRPCEKQWNLPQNAYKYDDQTLLKHTGNYGVLCGPGNLVVVDFDDAEYHRKVKDLMPKTFTVITAGKRLPHYYYILDEYAIEVKKVGIDVKDKRVCDIQSGLAGVVGPMSTINRKYYEPNDEDINCITWEQLCSIFSLKQEDKVKATMPNSYGTVKKDKVKHTISVEVLNLLKVEKRLGQNYQCPFHSMEGTGNLSVLPSGLIYCFHCKLQWWPDEFVAKVKNIGLPKARMVVKVVEGKVTGK